MQSNTNFHILLIGIQNDTTILEDRLVVSYKIKNILPYDPAIVSLGIYSEKMKTCVCTKTCIWMLMAALFIIAKLKSNKDVPH